MGLRQHIIAPMPLYYTLIPTTLGPLDLGHLPEPRRKIYATLRKVPSGTTLTYGELAELAGMPGTQQSVGTAMGENPCPVVIPCHRVLPAGGKLGAYTGPGG